jgi:hypothetical protein
MGFPHSDVVMRSFYGLRSPLLVAAPFLLATFTGFAVANGGPAKIAVLALVASAALVVGLSIGPQAVFLGWLVLAPFLQNDVRDTPVGHAAAILLYSAPPLLFFFWMLVGRKRVKGSLIDLFPGLYLGLVLVSAELTGSDSLTQIYAVIAIGVITYYCCVFGFIGDKTLERSILGTLLITGFIVSGLVILGKVTGLSWAYAANSLPSAGTTSERATGTLSNPAVLGTFLGSAFVLALAILVWNGPLSLRRLSLLVVIVAPPALLPLLARRYWQRLASDSWCSHFEHEVACWLYLPARP